jgi:hypothetical protein
MIENIQYGKELLENRLLLDGVEETLGKLCTANTISSCHKGDLLDQRRKLQFWPGPLFSSH